MRIKAKHIDINSLHLALGCSKEMESNLITNVVSQDIKLKLEIETLGNDFIFHANIEKIDIDVDLYIEDENADSDELIWLDMNGFVYDKMFDRWEKRVNIKRDISKTEWDNPVKANNHNSPEYDWTIEIDLEDNRVMIRN